jgi:VIT1/CCC1 family predicted Fe2+/Mn2+ transporter
MNNKVVNKDPTIQRESFTELLGQLANNSAAVVHDEIELVIQGIREKVRAVRSGVLTVATGAVVSFAAFLSLCAALVIGLTSYMAPVIAALVTGAALALIGVVIAFIGFKQLKKTILKT